MNLDKRKLLIISYFFPPFGGAGIGRPYALFRHLPEFDIEADVLTVKSIASRSFDHSLLQKIDEERIYRTKSFDPQRIMYLLGVRTLKNKTIDTVKGSSDRFFPDSKIGWVRQAVKLGRVLIENKRYDTILTTSPPISSHLVGLKLSREFNLNWIADFRDYWTSYKPEDWYQSDKKVKKANNLIEEISSKADVVTAVGEQIGNYLDTREIIPNSFNTELISLWREPDDFDNFVIGILGTIDRLTIVEPLFKLLVKMKETEPAFYDKIKIVQVGQINDPDFFQKVTKYELTDKIEIHHFQERKRTIEILRNSHMLYLGVNQDFEKGMITSRIYEMIASGRPVLCYVTESSELGSLIHSLGNGKTFHDDSLDAGVEYVKKKFKSWENRSLDFIHVTEAGYNYSSYEMAKKFAQLIKKF